MGYTRDAMGSLFMSWPNNVFIVNKNGKYGMIDIHGKVLYPCTQNNHRMGYYKGLVIVPENVGLLQETGYKEFSIWYNIYKDGVKVQEKISAHRGFDGINFMTFLGQSDDNINYWKNEGKTELPLSVKDTLMLDLNGKRVERVPFGKNYFRLGNDGQLVLEKKDGTPVFNEKVTFYNRGLLSVEGPYYVVEFLSDWARPQLLNENGDMVTADSKLLHYVNDGTVSFPDLRKYSAIIEVQFPYLKRQPKTDKLATLEYHAGRMSVKPQEEEKSFFSEGLINLRIDGEWCYMDESSMKLHKKD